MPSPRHPDDSPWKELKRYLLRPTLEEVLNGDVFLLLLPVIMLYRYSEQFPIRVYATVCFGIIIVLASAARFTKLISPWSFLILLMYTGGDVVLSVLREGAPFSEIMIKVIYNLVLVGIFALIIKERIALHGNEWQASQSRSQQDGDLT